MRLSLPITVAALALLVAACSSTSPSTTSPPSTTTTSPTPADPNAGLPTGTQLNALLAPASWFPRGFKLDPQSSVNTGNNYQSTAPPGVRKCRRLGATAWVQLGNGGAVSFAENVYFNQNAGQYFQEIDVYQRSTAQNVMAKLRQVAARCRSFHDAQTSSTVTARGTSEAQATKLAAVLTANLQKNG